MFLLLQVRLLDILLGRRKREDPPPPVITDPAEHARVLQEQEEIKKRMEVLAGRLETVEGLAPRLERIEQVLRIAKEQREGEDAATDE